MEFWMMTKHGDGKRGGASASTGIFGDRATDERVKLEKKGFFSGNEATIYCRINNLTKKRPKNEPNFWA